MTGRESTGGLRCLRGRSGSVLVVLLVGAGFWIPEKMGPSCSTMAHSTCHHLFGPSVFQGKVGAGCTQSARIQPDSGRKADASCCSRDPSPEHAACSDLGSSRGMGTPVPRPHPFCLVNECRQSGSGQRQVAAALSRSRGEPRGYPITVGRTQVDSSSIARPSSDAS